MKAPDWNVQELETLLQHPGADDQAVAELLPKRDMGAVNVIRQGVHAFHQEGTSKPLLSEMVVRRLERGSVTCPVCKARF